MVGQLPGTYFQLVIGNLLTASMLMPDLKARVDAMDPAGMYAWDEYVGLVREVADLVSDRVVVNVGKKVVTQSKEYFADQGFDSIESILGDWGALFSANIVGAPERDMVVTVSAKPGQARIRAGIVQPLPLVEGYLRGVVEMFSGWVTKLEVRPVVHEEHRYNLFDIHYQA